MQSQRLILGFNAVPNSNTQPAGKTQIKARLRLLCVNLTVKPLSTQDWKAGEHCMGDVRAYSPQPPPCEDVEMDLSTYSLKFVKVQVDSRKQGWEKFKFELPPNVRALHSKDVVYGAEWRGLVAEFDEKLLALFFKNHEIQQ